MLYEHSSYSLMNGYDWVHHMLLCIFCCALTSCIFQYEICRDFIQTVFPLKE